MTTLALPILVLLIIVLLLLIAGWILRQRSFIAQTEIMEEIRQRLYQAEALLQDISEQQLQQSRQEEENTVCTEEPDDAKDSPELKTEEPAEKTEEQAQIKEEPPQTDYETVLLQEMLSAGTAPRESEGHLEAGSKTPEATIYNIGKSGKIYTKEELELLIKE